MEPKVTLPAVWKYDSDVLASPRSPTVLIAIPNTGVTASQLTLRSQRAAIVTTNVLGGIDFQSNDTSVAAPGTISARIQALANGTHNASNIDTDLVFSTMLGTTLSEAGRITPNGTLQWNQTSTATSGSKQGITTTLTVTPSVSSAGQKRALQGIIVYNAALTHANGVIGVYADASVAPGVAATLSGAGSSSLSGGMFLVAANDATVNQANGVYFDAPSVNDGVITSAAGLRIGTATITGAGSITTLTGIVIPAITQGGTNWDIFHTGTSPNIGIGAGGVLTWKDGSGNVLMTLTDSGSTGNVNVTGKLGAGIAPTGNGQLQTIAGTGTGIAKVGGTLVDYFTDTSVGGAEADIYTYTTPASTLAANGDKFSAYYGGNFVTVGTELTQLKVYFAGTALWDSTALAPATGTTSWRVGVDIIRVSASVVRYSVYLNTSGATGYVYETTGELTGLTLSNTNILKVTGTSSGVGSGAGDIVGKMGSVMYRPAA